MQATVLQSSLGTTHMVTKSICFRYNASDQLRSLFEAFRLMCNDAIRIAVKANPKNRFSLIELAYPRLKESHTPGFLGRSRDRSNTRPSGMAYQSTS